MHRRTKIIATLGPATDNPLILGKIIEAGVNLVRLNFSHGTADTHRERVKALRESPALEWRHIGIIADLQGPKIRIERFAQDKILLQEGQPFILDAACPSDAGNTERVGLAYKQLPYDVKKGDILLLDDGRIVLQVKRVAGVEIHCETFVGGVLSNNKGINRQGGGLSAEALTHKDRQDLLVAAELQVDYVAISFPRDANDMQQARQLLEATGSRAGLIAKIERAEALKNYEEIIKASDAIMVARGDLGVEIGDAALPAAQKLLISKARDCNKAVITATQMMESMIDNPIPTRAEVSDVANAVFDGTDAVMLSAETAAGRYPDKAVKAMDRVCREAEKQPLARKSDYRVDATFGRVDESIAMASMYVANHLNIQAIASLTESGSTVLWMSRINSMIPIFAFSRHAETCRKVTLYRGVHPVLFDLNCLDTIELNCQVTDKLKQFGIVSDHDLVLITKGDLKGISGGTNVMKIIGVGQQQLFPIA
ncbi:pyruvate kinase [Thioflexithrix psekupsensis]|uniref:Pyruvate kinase n=1 Tax=Thioflexithrix psekupsensis TaxID=1570016 RepID=A0A251X8L4_9GAMM|nr:pyruvate kinase [Thioflexithrix psekupsensis]OUD14408.1 pyruvate kinase [Thioflexithrix psekupsensis]